MDIFYPIQFFADHINRLFGLQKESYVGSAVNFFVYDTIKIGLLLIVINYLMAIIRYYLPIEKIRDVLTKKRWSFFNYLMAAIFGMITPFCSCSSIPLFIGFLGAGIPLGVTFAFLISSPLINESSLYLFPAMFGLKIALLYNIFGLMIAVFGGMLIQKLKMEKYVIPELLTFKSRAQIEIDNGGRKLNTKQLVRYFWKDGASITLRIFPYVILGIGVGALIYGFVPADFVERYFSSEPRWAVPMAVLFGAPLYANSVSVIPIMEAMIGKGIPLGTVLAFMTSIVTFSLPEVLILKKVMRWQLLAIFLGMTAIGIVIMGYIFNII